MTTRLKLLGLFLILLMRITSTQGQTLDVIQSAESHDYQGKHHTYVCTIQSFQIGTYLNLFYQKLKNSQTHIGVGFISDSMSNQQCNLYFIKEIPTKIAIAWIG